MIYWPMRLTDTQAAKAAECSQWSARYLKQLISSEINKFAEFNRVQKEQRATTTATQGESRKQTGNWSVSEADNTQSKSESESESYALSKIVESVLKLVQ